MPNRSSIACADFTHTHANRRTFLQIGTAGIAGLTLPNLLRAEQSKPRHRAKAKNVIMLFQFGGPPQLDTFDPKPNAPAEIRGEFASIPTSLPGVRYSEHLPRLSKLAHKLTLVRSVHHNRSSHNPGAYYSLTGREPQRDIVTLNASATDFPHPGSIVSALSPGDGRVPPFVSLPTMIADGPFRTPGEFAGFLGKMHDPLWILGDPNHRNFKVDDLTLPDGLAVSRIADRRNLLTGLDKLSRLADQRELVQGMQAYQQRAMDLLTSPAMKTAIELDRESPAIRDRYGRTTYGQSTLLARRLIEAGVRFTCVYYSAGIGGWDTHKDNFKTLKDSRLPQTDQTVSALITDLEERGLLDETIVFWTGDFGRTPKINGDAGRDHWPQCMTVMFAGGGMKPGYVHGASDANGAHPADKPCKPDDLMATLFAALGHDPETMLRDQLDRPIPIAAGAPLPLLA
ncbi:DUF1501 domain-containing protein [Tuwongella immobilis]|uniref:DUF1501 domain-containing protein n=1 Tax=Tuwongella immobilis TaxID=692036 RepID=A0A6C2YKK5_9BACT|nr:DUF1501 domain-containing protein [Tuwongella immobilis]VIP01904.1 hypothetical protein : Uncharacterized protein OS=Singulisphaera acidiphila (strain ATCC BAA-1392 / DSM 18658 / VKM B-2454 / MOB10) GN=Sinac_2308 PE=4 SV=1: DUF1501 [Tuwongella immobilis]VTR99800.1 hypothetical protein : Uncharacterized protein OS=Singulisphaera acidiphila (strain ATCC BAA-1392 / DSM 18658 / VKM B-2454 / MOB10) GN=Sinac_2308 PE=4 SV=1: DUF1501 [Tuwongella immobilis]